VLYIVARANRLGARDSISLTAARNTNDFVPLLVRTCVRARLKVDARAYLHWYEKYGCYQVCHLHIVVFSFGYAFEKLVSMVGKPDLIFQSPYF